MVLAVRPASVDEALYGVSLRPGSVLVSAVAGMSEQSLRRRLGADVDVVRAIPLPAVRSRRGTTAIYPGQSAVAALFDRLGRTVVSPSEAALSVLSATTATISAHLTYLATVAEWATKHGVPAADAEQYVASVFAGVSHRIADRTEPLADVVTAHETPDGINEHFRETWFDAPNQAALQTALDAVAVRLLAQSQAN